MPINAKYAVLAFLSPCCLFLKALFDLPEIDLVLGPTLFAGSYISFWKSVVPSALVECYFKNNPGSEDLSSYRNIL